MMWSPPRSRMLRNSVPQTACWLSVVSCCAAGCSTLAQLDSSLSRAVPEQAQVALADSKPDAVRDSESIPAPVFDDLPAPPSQVTAKPAAPSITAPTPFAWTTVGKSAGGRPFQVISVGREGYRTLVVGSVGGHDPIAGELVDRLARHIHDNSPIMGGFETSVIRTLNPDGAANSKHVNQNGVYLNGAFPSGKGTSTATKDDPPEVAFLLDQVNKVQPQRVIHVRTVQGKRGVIAASSSAMAVAQEAASWLDMDLVALSSKSGSGSLERYITVRGDSQIITLGIPVSTPSNVVWDRYRDTMLNLLLSENLQARELARRQKEQNSADRRGGNVSPARP